jgi:hypothetical protein
MAAARSSAFPRLLLARITCSRNMQMVLMKLGQQCNKDVHQYTQSHRLVVILLKMVNIRPKSPVRQLVRRQKR